jgi:hypothetical protein
MRSQRNSERQGANILFIAAILLACLLLCTQSSGLKLVIDSGVISVEMKLAFLEMTFDFGQLRSKTNSLMVIVG